MKPIKKKRGNCYYACEALWHLLGGKDSSFRPAYLKVNGETHWILKGPICLDPTHKQFPKGTIIDYGRAKGCGFLTKRPSKKAKVLMDKLLWQYLT